jgi:hypothetical protein
VTASPAPPPSTCSTSTPWPSGWTSCVSTFTETPVRREVVAALRAVRSDPTNVGDVVWMFPDPQNGEVVRTVAIKFTGDKPTKAQLDHVSAVPVFRDGVRLRRVGAKEHPRPDLCTRERIEKGAPTVPIDGYCPNKKRCP